MPWNPDTYNKFKSERFEPFYDVLNLIRIKPGMDVVDLGCGTGELTRKLADALPGSSVLGIDSSREMLDQSREFEHEGLRFELRSIEAQVESFQKWDLVFSNAALQWVENHEVLFQKIISGLKPNGQMAIQMPAQHHNISNRILHLLADEPPYQKILQGWKRISPVLDIDRYAGLIYKHGGTNIIAYEKIYPLILPDAHALFDWVSGTALLPYLERLHGESRQKFIDEYKNRLHLEFDKTPVFYPFRRIILSAMF